MRQPFAIADVGLASRRMLIRIDLRYRRRRFIQKLLRRWSEKQEYWPSRSSLRC